MVLFRATVISHGSPAVTNICNLTHLATSVWRVFLFFFFLLQTLHLLWVSSLSLKITDNVMSHCTTALRANGRRCFMIWLGQPVSVKKITNELQASVFHSQWSENKVLFWMFFFFNVFLKCFTQAGQKWKGLVSNSVVVPILSRIYWFHGKVRPIQICIL